MFFLLIQQKFIPLGQLFLLMKKIFSFSCLVMALPAMAQSFHENGENSSILSFPTVDTRTEIIIPQVDGYNVIKADLHTHTIYSDGSVTPQYRVAEAWKDGLDVIAITDHIEYRPIEKHMKKFLNTNVTENPSDNDEIRSDLDYPCTIAESNAKKYGITLIHGAEITRNPGSTGHFNLLFTTNNKLIPDPDPLQAIRNAKAQGAIVQCNHPGWRREDNEFTKVAKAALKEGLIDGVEVFNTAQFYPNVIQRAEKLGLYISSCSDIHGTSDSDFGQYNVYRNMTLILAKDNSPESLRDALVNKRTLAYSYGQIAGSEALLKDLFNACVKVECTYTDKKGYNYIKISNHSSLPFTLDIKGRYAGVVVPKMSTISFRTTQDKLQITVTNMWCGEDKHPVL